jgi:hypothetical protein
MPVDLSVHINFESYYLPLISKAKREGDELTGLCPFHPDKSPSFSVNLQTGLWKCYAGCGGGNIVDYHAKANNLSTKEAYQKLCEIYVPESRNPKQSKKPTKTIPIETLELFKNIPAKALAYLLDKRGWSKEIITRYGIGYCDKKRFDPGNIGEHRFTIPVYSDQGELVNIRSYKPGSAENKLMSWSTGSKKKQSFIGFGESRLFPLSILQEAKAKDEYVILCEGEPDCLCGNSHGLHCITQTAGAGTWKDEFNSHFKGVKVLIAYDNDEEGRAGADRVSKHLPHFAKSVEVIQWPSFMGEKEDLTDWFMRHSKTAAELLELPRTKAEPKKDEPKKLQPLIKEAGAYFKIEFTKGVGAVRTKISNFTLAVQRNFLEPSGVVRHVKLIHESGNYSREAELVPQIMSSKQAFGAWCFAQGNFVWKGTITDLEKLWELELETNDGRIIHRPGCIGYLQKEKLWLFGDSAVQNGKVYLPDDEHIIWINEQGYQPFSLTAGNSDAQHSLLPVYRFDLSDAILDATRDKMVQLLKENLQGFNAYLALGFVAACAYYEEIFRVHKGFPLLYIYGPRQCGKNTLAGIIMAHLGLTESSANNATNTSVVGFNRKLDHYSSIPVWLDEYRSNDPKCSKHDSSLRSAYDRVGGSKGKLGPGVTTPRINSPVIVTAEFFPEDPAFWSRCATIHLSANRRSTNVYPEIQRLLPQISGLFHRLVREKTDDRVRNLLEAIEKTKTFLEKEGMDPRLAGIYSTLSEAFCEIYDPGDVNRDRREFGAWLVKETHRIRQEKEEDFVTNDFFYDLEVMKSQKMINGDHVEIRNRNVNGDLEPDEICIWLRGVYNIWSESKKRRGESACGYKDIIKYLRDEPYYKGEGIRKINKKDRRASILNAPRLPADVLQVFISGWGENHDPDD